MRAPTGGPLPPEIARRALTGAGLIAACAAFALAALAAPVPGPGASGPSVPGAKPAPAPGPSVSGPSAPRAKPAPPAKAGDEHILTILYGDDHAFGIIAPPGWVIDDSSGLGYRIRAVLYPRDVHWKDATTIMYESCYHRDPRRPATLSAILENDAAKFRARSPKGKLTTAPAVTTSKGKVAQVRLLAPTGGEPLEAIAYLEESSLFVLLVLHAERSEAFKDAYPRFRDMVTSYQLVAENIQTPTTDRPK
jgi:hypothetical protein